MLFATEEGRRNQKDTNTLQNLKLAQDKSVPPSVPEFSKEEFT